MKVAVVAVTVTVVIVKMKESTVNAIIVTESRKRREILEMLVPMRMKDSLYIKVRTV
jgi:hypothetical protein